MVKLPKKREGFVKRFKKWKLISRVSFIGSMLTLVSLILMVIFYYLPNKKDSYELNRLYQNAKSYFDNYDYSKSIIYFEKLFEIDPYFPGCAYHYAKLLYDRKNFGEALRVVRFIPETDNFYDKFFIIGLVQDANNNFQEAIASWTKSLDKLAANGDPNYWVAKCLILIDKNENKNADCFFVEIKDLCNEIDFDILNTTNKIGYQGKPVYANSKDLFKINVMQNIAFNLYVRLGDKYFHEANNLKSFDSYMKAFDYSKSPSEIERLQMKTEKNVFSCVLSKITKILYSYQFQKDIYIKLANDFAKKLSLIRQECKTSYKSIEDFCCIWEKIIKGNNESMEIVENCWEIVYCNTFNPKNSNDIIAKVNLDSSKVLGFPKEYIMADSSPKICLSKVLERGVISDDSIFLIATLCSRNGQIYRMPLIPYINYLPCKGTNFDIPSAKMHITYTIRNPALKN